MCNATFRKVFMQLNFTEEPWGRKERLRGGGKETKLSTNSIA